jgi:hypothetical protein
MKSICGVSIVSSAHLYNFYCVRLTVPYHAVYCLCKNTVDWRIAWPCSVANTRDCGIFQLRVCTCVHAYVHAVGNRDLALKLQNLK